MNIAALLESVTAISTLCLGVDSGLKRLISEESEEPWITDM